MNDKYWYYDEADWENLILNVTNEGTWYSQKTSYYIQEEKNESKKVKLVEHQVEKSNKERDKYLRKFNKRG